jgi:hypothetical protein
MIWDIIVHAIQLISIIWCVRMAIRFIRDIFNERNRLRNEKSLAPEPERDPLLDTWDDNPNHDSGPRDFANNPPVSLFDPAVNEARDKIRVLVEAKMEEARAIIAKGGTPEWVVRALTDEEVISRARSLSRIYAVPHKAVYDGEYCNICGGDGTDCSGTEDRPFPKSDRVPPDKHSPVPPSSDKIPPDGAYGAYRLTNDEVIDKSKLYVRVDRSSPDCTFPSCLCPIDICRREIKHGKK